MKHPASHLDCLLRPRVLVVASRHALGQYDRAQRLPRLLRLACGQTLPPARAALEALLACERKLEHARRHHDASWRAAEHVAVMTAILHEARALDESAGVVGLARAG